MARFWKFTALRGTEWFATGGRATSGAARRIGLALGCVLISAAPAQDEAGGLPEIELSAGVTRLIEARHLSEEERRAARLRHGVWQESDLVSAADRARAALQRGAFNDVSLLDESVAAELRAAGMVARGELEDAAALLEREESIEAIRLRAEALAGLGRHAQADRALDALVSILARARVEDADALSEGVRGLMLRERLGGTRRAIEGDAQARAAVQADFQTMSTLLARARDELDRMSWKARLVEAALLFEKDNRAQGIEASIEALGLNQGLSEAWFLLGNHFVDTFDFSRAAHVARKLDELRWSVVGEDETRSLLGDLVRARERLRQNDAARAAEILDGVLERYPKSRRALALRAATAAAMFDDEQTKEWLARFDALSPGAPEALFEVGKQLSEDRQYAEAAEYLEAAHARLETWPEPLIELGLLEMQSGRDIRAREALTRAMRLDPFHARADNSLRLIEELLTYARIESEHFEIRYKPGIDELLAREMPAILERIHARVTGSEAGGIDHEPAVKTVIELMPDHRWFSVRITGMAGIHTMAAATGPVIALESPREGPNHLVGEYDWARVIQHEYTHTVTLSRTNNRIPHWFTEAAAVYLEDSPRSWDWCQLLSAKFKADELFDLEEINVRFTRPIEPTDRTQAYAQGHWMYAFLIDRWGTDAPLRLMDEYAQGRTEADAMRSVLGIEPEAFMAEFLLYAQADLRRWGMLTPEGMASIHELRKEYFDGPDAPGSVTEEAIDAWLAQYPEHPDVLMLALQEVLADRRGEGDREIALGEREVELLERLAAARPVDPTPRRILTRHFMRSEEPARAIVHLEWLDAREEHSAAYAAELARRYEALGDLEAARKKAERVTRIAPFDAAGREAAARVSILVKDDANALRHLEALAMIEPDREIHGKRIEALRKLAGGG